MAFQYKSVEERFPKPGKLESAARNLVGSAANVIGLLGEGIGQLGSNLPGLMTPIGFMPNWTMPYIRDVGSWLSEQGQKIQQPARLSPQWESKDFLDRVTDWNYWTDPQGATADIFSGFGSSLPFMGIGLGTRAMGAFLPTKQIASKLFGKGFDKFAKTNLGKALVETADTGLNYAGTVAPLDALTNAAEIIKPLKERGFTDAEISRLMLGSMGEELPIDLLENFITGNTIFGKGFGLRGKTWKGRLGYGSLNIPLEMGGEYMQEGYQTRATQKYQGLPYTESPLQNFLNTGELFATPEERSAAVSGAIGGLLPATGGTVIHSAFGGERETTPTTDEYRGEGGKGENNTWVRQHGGVSLDRAQPGLLDAIDMLAKKFSDDNNGLKLVVTSGNDGHSHTAGDHDHYQGWKVDIADAGANGVGINEDGVFFTKDFQPTPYLYKFIEYGHKLGLGMNIEDLGTSNVHIDVALDGNQWADEYGRRLDTPQNFGGFNSKDGTPSTEQENTYDANFTDRQNHIWQMAQRASRRAKDKYNYDIPPELIYKQWSHESGANFDDNKILADVHNFGGLTQIEPNDLPQPDGNNYYRKFANDEEFADAYIDDFIEGYPEINGVKTEREFAEVLKSYGYYGDTVENYTADMEGIQVPKGGYSNRKGGKNSTPTTEETADDDDSFYQRLIADILNEDTKPQFNAMGDDDFTKSILSDFVAEKRDEATGSELLTLDSMFDDKDNFINSAKNRAKLAELYGDDLADFGQERLDARLSELGGNNSALENLTVDDRKVLGGVIKSKLDDAGVKLGGNVLKHLNEGDANAFKKALAGLEDAQKNLSTQGLPEELSTEISRLRDEIKALSDRGIQASTKAEFDETNKQIKARSAKIDSIRTLGKDITKLETDLQKASENLIKANATGNTDKITKASDKVSTLQTQLDKKQSELQKILSPQVQDATPQTAPPANQQTADFIANLNAEIQSLKEQLTPNLPRNQIQPLTQQIQDKTAQLDKINKLNAQIDTLTTQAADAYNDLQNPEKQEAAIKQLNDATQKIQNAETELAKLVTPQIQDATPKAEPSKKFAPVKAKADERIATLNNQIDALRTQDEIENADEIEKLTDSRYAIQAVVDEMAELDAQFKPLIQARNEADKNNDAKAYNAAKRKVDALSKKYKTKSKGLDKLLNPSQETPQKVQETFEPVNEEIATALASIAQQKSELDAQGRRQNAKQITDLNKRRDKIQAGNNELAKLQSQVDAKESELAQTTDVAKQNALKDQIASLYSKIDSKMTALSNFINPPQEKPKAQETFEASADVQARIDAINARIRELRNSGEAKNSAEIANLSQQSKAIQNASNEIGKLTAQRTNAENEGNAQEVNRLTGKIAGLNNKINAAQKAVDKILNPPQKETKPEKKPPEREYPDLSEVNNELSAIAQRSAELKAQGQRANANELDKLNKRRDKIQKGYDEIAEINAKISKAEKELVSLTDEKAKSKKEDELTGLYSSIDGKIKALSNFINPPQKPQKAQENYEPSEKVQEKIDAINERIRELRNAGEEKNSEEIAKLSRQRDALQNASNELEKLKAQRTKAEQNGDTKEVNHLTGKIAGLNSKINATIKKVDEILTPPQKESKPEKKPEPAKPVNQQTAQTISRLNSDIERLDAQLTPDLSDEQYSAVKAQLDGKRARLEQIKSLNEEISAAQKQKDEIRTAAKKARETGDEVTNADLRRQFGSVSERQRKAHEELDNLVSEPVSDEVAEAVAKLNAEIRELENQIANTNARDEKQSLLRKYNAKKNLVKKILDTNQEVVAAREKLETSNRNGNQSEYIEAIDRYEQAQKKLDKYINLATPKEQKPAKIEETKKSAETSPMIETETTAPKETKIVETVTPAKPESRQIESKPTPQSETTTQAESSPQRTQEQRQSPKKAESKTKTPAQSETKAKEVTEENEDEYTTDDGSIFGSIESAEKRMLESLKKLGIEPLDKKSQSKKTATTEEDTRRPKLVNFVDDSDESLNRELEELRKELSKLSAMPMFNPKVWKSALKIGAIYVQRGINNFVDWASKMTETIGDKIQPWNSAVWETINALPEGSKFDEEQVMNIAGYIGSLTEKNEATTFEDIQARFEEKIGKEATERITPMIEASYKGIQKFFADRQQETESTTQPQTEEKAPETKKAAVIVTGDEFGEYADLGDLRKKAIQYYSENLQGTSVQNENLGKIDIDENGLIEFTTAGKKKLQSTSRESNKLLLVKHLRELLKTAHNVRTAESVKEKHKQDTFIYMNNDVEIDGNIVPIHITLIKRNNGDIQYYNHNFIKENKKHASEPARPESSNEALGTLPDSVSSAEDKTSNKNIPQETESDKDESGLVVANETQAADLFDLSKVQLPPNPSEKFRTAYRGIQETLDAYRNNNLDLPEVKTKVNELVNKAKFTLDEEKTDARHKEIDILNGINDAIQNKTFTPEQQEINDKAMKAFFMLQRTFTRLHDTGKVPDDEYKNTRKQINQLDYEMTSGKKSALTAFQQLREILSEVTNEDVNDYLSTANPAKESRSWKIWSGGFEAAMEAFNNGVDLINFDALDIAIESGAWEKLIASLPETTVKRLLSEDKKQRHSRKKVQAESAEQYPEIQKLDKRAKNLLEQLRDGKISEDAARKQMDYILNAQSRNERTPEQIKKALADLAEAAWADNQFKETLSFTPSKKFRDKVQELFGHDVNKVFVTADDVRHIKAEHSENEEQRGQINLKPENIAEIYDVVNDFDSATKEHDDAQGNRNILVVKKADGTSYVVLIERGKSKVQVKTFYKHKGASQMSDAKSPNLNAQSDSVTAPLSEVETSAENISQPEQNGKKKTAEEAQKQIVDLIKAWRKRGGADPNGLNINEDYAEKLAKIASDGIIDSDTLIDTANKLLNGNESEKKQAEDIYYDTVQKWEDKRIAEFSPTKAIARLNEIAEKFPVMKNNVEREIKRINDSEGGRLVNDDLSLTGMTDDQVEQWAAYNLIQAWRNLYERQLESSIWTDEKNHTGAAKLNDDVWSIKNQAEHGEIPTKGIYKRIEKMLSEPREDVFTDKEYYSKAAIESRVQYLYFKSNGETSLKKIQSDF